MLENNLNSMTNMICPITGVPLEYVGHDKGVMDGNSYYSPKSNDPKIKDLKIVFARHPFQWNMIRLVEYKSYMAKASRYFELLEDNT